MIVLLFQIHKMLQSLSATDIIHTYLGSIYLKMILLWMGAEIYFFEYAHDDPWYDKVSPEDDPDINILKDRKIRPTKY